MPVFRKLIQEKLQAAFSFAPAHANRQRAAAVASLGLVYYEEGKYGTAEEHVPDYLAFLRRKESGQNGKKRKIRRLHNDIS